MPGIYIHIPFCRKACHYCDFHFSTTLKNKEKMVEMICTEIELQQAYLGNKNITSLYFGGGTPSLLGMEDIYKIITRVNSFFNLAKDAEITLEANPDDLDKKKTEELKAAGINRLSIGVQSFFDEDLALINRTHSGKQATAAIAAVQKAGFNNISIDLIYGLPGLTKDKWENNLKQAFDSGVPHISAYSLTVEKRTALHHFIKIKKLALPDEERVIGQFETLMESAERQGFIHYEISNFCKPAMHSRHNSSYWNNEPYLGIGPSAHSYNGSSRQWNISNNALYLRCISERKCWFEKEELTDDDKYNEHIMTRMRTNIGINLSNVKKYFGEEKTRMLLSQLQSYTSTGLLHREKENVFLTRKGILLADKISSELFI